MRARGLLLAVVVASGVGATSAQATTKDPWDGTYLLNQRHTPGYLKTDCPDAKPPIHLKQEIAVRAARLPVLNNMVQGHPIVGDDLSATARWTQRITVAGGFNLLSFSYHFSDIGGGADVTYQLTTTGHYGSGVGCTVYGSIGNWGKRVGK